MSLAVLGTLQFSDYTWLARQIETLFMAGPFAGQGVGDNIHDTTCIRQRAGILLHKTTKLGRSRERKSKKAGLPPSEAFRCTRIVTSASSRGVDWYAAKFAHNAMLPLTLVARGSRMTRTEHARLLVTAAHIVLVLTDGVPSRFLDAIMLYTDAFAVPVIIRDVLTHDTDYIRCEPTAPLPCRRVFEPRFITFCVDKVLGSGASEQFCVVRFESNDELRRHTEDGFAHILAYWSSVTPHTLVGAISMLKGGELQCYAFLNDHELEVCNFEAPPLPAPSAPGSDNEDDTSIKELATHESAAKLQMSVSSPAQLLPRRDTIDDHEMRE